MENDDVYQTSGSFVDLLGSPVVFMHDVNTLPNFSRIISQVNGIEKYERALPIARSEDIVIIKFHPEKSYTKWLEKVGFGSSKILVVNGMKMETLPERVIKRGFKEHLASQLGSNQKSAVISPYYGGPLEQKASKYLELDMYTETKIVNKIDSKINFKDVCREIGIPVIQDSICTINKLKLKNCMETIDNHRVETGKVIIKGEFGASASSTYIIDRLDSSRIQEIEKNSQIGDRYIIEPFYDALSHPSSTWFVSKNKKIFHLKTSNQILDKQSSHIGNEFPVKFDENKVQKFSFKIAKYLCKEGYIGPFGIDFIESKDGLFAAECNPRVTGAMYPWELVHRLEKNGPIKAARTENIQLPQNGNSYRFQDLLKLWDDVMYDGQNDQNTIIPFNVGPISNGKITVLVTGSSKNEVLGLFDYIKCKLRNQ